MINKKTHSDIKNPQRTVLLRWIFVDVFFILLALHSILNFNINSFHGLFIIVSTVIVITSAFFILSTIKNMKRLDDAINKGKRLAYWKYTRDEWNNYLNHEEKFRFEEGKLVAIVLFAITAIVFIPFILIIPDGKFAMFLVMIALFALYFFMGWLFPMFLFYLKRMTIGEVILLEKGVLLHNNFHTWDFPLSKFSHARFVKTPYEHLAIAYDFFDRTGPRSYVVNVPIPKNNKQDIKNIISKFN